MNRALQRKLWITGVILVVVLAIIYGFLPRTQEVDFVRVMRGPLQVTIEEEGRTRLRERFVISAPTAGYLRRIGVKVGDPLKKGQTVAVLEPLRSQALDPRSRAEAEAVVSAAEASLSAATEKERAATADADYTEKRLARISKLYAGGSVAKDQFDQTESEAAKARAVQRSARAAGMSPAPNWSVQRRRSATSPRSKEAEGTLRSLRPWAAPSSDSIGKARGPSRPGNP